MKVEEMNKVIAEWMLDKDQDWAYVKNHIKDFKPHESWDDLMPVIDEIMKEIGLADGYSDVFDILENSYADVECMSSIRDVHQAVYKYISRESTS